MSRKRGEPSHWIAPKARSGTLNALSREFDMHTAYRGGWVLQVQKAGRPGEWTGLYVIVIAPRYGADAYVPFFSLPIFPSAEDAKRAAETWADDMGSPRRKVAA